MLDLDGIFSESGPLAERIPGYQLRMAQQEMAAKIAHAIDSKHHFIAEAGTGIGKTLAYLVPTALSGQRTIISTGTRNLQDQLYNKDIPLVCDALSLPVQAVLLKGRSNYLCRYRLAKTMDSDTGLRRQEVLDLRRIESWARTTRSGDIAEVTHVSESSSIWYQVTSTADNCLGQECPDYQECFLVKTRRKAQAAEVVVINHHLLCADWVLRDDGFGELLPDVDVMIVDEAHQLYETATRFLGASVSARQIFGLCKDVLLEFHQEASDMPKLRSAAEKLEKSVRDARLTFGQALRRGSWEEIVRESRVMRALQDVGENIHQLGEILNLAAERTKGLESCFRRCNEIGVGLKQFVNDQDVDWIRWYETHQKSFTLNRTPFEIANDFQQMIGERDANWIFTSATLAVAGRFDHFKSSLGLQNTQESIWDSPFNFSEQCLFYHPRHLPDPASPDYVETMVEMVLPVLKASRGRAFFLFTSHRSLRLAAEILQAKVDFPLLIQGSQPKAYLIKLFKETENAVLLGTASFWEGVDVRGEALSCVIIDKLPFASPGDPVMKARLDHLRRDGQNPFACFQLPLAVIALKQGAGRLIRDHQDRGVFMLCDPRLLKRSYGKVFLDSLPPMRRTRSIADVESFFNQDIFPSES